MDEMDPRPLRGLVPPWEPLVKDSFFDLVPKKLDPGISIDDALRNQ